MAIRAANGTEAWELANILIPNCELSSRKSETAGYKVFEDTRGNCINDLCARLELNFNDGNTINIWISADSSSYGNMKSREAIDKRIASIEQQVEWYKEDINRATQELSRKVAKYAEDPMYVSRWMESWMQPIASAEVAINELQKTMAMLKWVID